MEYLQVARELASIVPTAREAYRDMLWLYGVARATWTPAASSAPEVEMVACFRECLPLEHEAEVWSTECEYDCEEWVHCGISESMAPRDDAPRHRVRDHTFPSLAEVCAYTRLHEDMSSLSPGSSPGLSQGEVPERVPKNTNGGSSAPALGPPLSSS